MTDETEQTDDHLAMIAKANGKAPADDHSHRSEQYVNVPVDNRGIISTNLSLIFSVVGLASGLLGLALALVALSDASHVAEAASSAARASAKAETATARANVSEIYAKQVYTELNRLGYPVKTPAEEHAPQPSDNVSEVPGK